MKAVLFFKILVGIMSTLMIAGFIVIFIKLADNNAQRKLKTQSVTTTPISAPMHAPIIEKGVSPAAYAVTQTVAVSAMGAGETIVSVQSCGENVCIVTNGHAYGYKLIVLRPHLPEDMIVQKIIFLQK